jgi:hypothetical protein
MVFGRIIAAAGTKHCRGWDKASRATDPAAYPIDNAGGGANITRTVDDGMKVMKTMARFRA